MERLLIPCVCPLPRAPPAARWAFRPACRAKGVAWPNAPRRRGAVKIQACVTNSGLCSRIAPLQNCPETRASVLQNRTSSRRQPGASLGAQELLLNAVNVAPLATQEHPRAAPDFSRSEFFDGVRVRPPYPGRPAHDQQRRHESGAACVAPRGTGEEEWLTPLLVPRTVLANHSRRAPRCTSSRSRRSELRRSSSAPSTPTTRSGRRCSTRSAEIRVRVDASGHPPAAVNPPLPHLTIRRLHACADIRTERWEPGPDGSQRRARSFQSPFETALLNGEAKVQEDQAVKCAADGSRLVLAASVAMDGDVPYCDCYRVHTLIDVTNLSDTEQAEGLLVRVFMGAEFVKWTLFESRIKEMISSCAAESWESWEEEAVRYLEQGPPTQGDESADFADSAATSRRGGVENTFEIDRGDGVASRGVSSSSESEYETDDDDDDDVDLTSLPGLQQLFNEFFSSINTVEQFREPNVRLDPLAAAAAAAIAAAAAAAAIAAAIAAAAAAAALL